MNNPTISICIPAYRAARYLPETLETVRKQSFTSWELIVTEDGSDDGTGTIVSDFAQTVQQSVRYFREPTNQGLPATRNAGIAKARAEWIALLDSDDLWAENHLETCLATAVATGADLVHGGSHLFDSDTGARMERRAPSQATVLQLPLSLFDGRYIIQPASVLLRKALWERVGGFDPAFRYVEDRDMWLRCTRAGSRIAYTGQETCLYRKHSAGLSTHSAAMAEASARVYEKHLDWDAVPVESRQRYCAEAWAATGRLQWRTAPGTAVGSLQRALALRWDLRCAILLQIARGMNFLKP